MELASKLPISPAEGLSRLQDCPTEFVELFKHGSLIVEFYKPDRVDKQQPHDRDEVYVITSGSGTFDYAGAKMLVKTGDLLFVPTGVDHHFERFTNDFATWVLFYGPKGGEKEDSFIH